MDEEKEERMKRRENGWGEERMEVGGGEGWMDEENEEWMRRRENGWGEGRMNEEKWKEWR